ncbi:poly(ADP-ribose) glycohydrolase-like isoform X2 [Arctopsyche grandis]|uniref:poly(ADP-ribose) glycohydrolase-like isoform X2 n=1 Tax=Arctopsyche grandis TaxID=121162 RepID=UPI00406D9A37
MAHENMADSPDMFADSEDFMDIDMPPECDVDNIGVNKKVNEIASASERGVPIGEIIGADSPWDAPEFPKIAPAYNHTVLYHIYKSNSTHLCNDPPVPQQGRDVWNKDYVRMPFSNQSLYPVEEDGETVLKNRWDLINLSLSRQINNSYELEDAILEYNSKYEKQWKFTALHKLYNEYLEEEETEHFFKGTLPLIIDLVLRTPEIVPNSIPLLRQHHNRSISLSQLQVSCLLANAFFCTFPRRNSRKAKSEYSTYPDINFNRIFQCTGSKSVLEKLKCICHYFRRVCKKVPCGVVTFTRASVEITKCPNWSKSNALIGSVPIHIDSKGTIENEGAGLLQVDFANKFLGGGVLGYGCVQEEIRFVICPELLISMLFTECLRPTEALLMIGCERYSNYAGYADTFSWSGSHEDMTQRDSSGRLKCAIIAIDALSFNNPSVQYKPEYITRELNKAWVGFSVCADNLPGNTFPGVATGNWGCGAFCGSPYLKSLLQLMACCVARRPMAYFTFGDTQLRDDIINMYNFLSQNNISVGDLYGYLCEFSKSSASGKQLYPFLLQFHKDRQNVNLLKTRQFFTKIINKSDENLPTKTFYGEKSNVESALTVCNDSDLVESGNAVNTAEGIQVTKKIPDDVIDVDEIEDRSSEPSATTTAQQSTSKQSFFDTVSFFCETNNTQTKKESPVKKKAALSFFEKSLHKSHDVTSDKKDVARQIARESDATDEIKCSQEAKIKVEVHSNKKSGKISDYFQRLQKH